MNPSMWFPFVLVASAPAERRQRLAEAMIPAMMPLPPAQQVAVSAVWADTQVRGEERRVAQVQAQEAERHRLLLEEAVSATQILINRPGGLKFAQGELDKFTHFKAALESRPDLLAKIQL